MNYSEMSDFEINEAVSKTLLSEAANPNARFVAIGDYCRSWADAGPIIDKNGIAILPFKKTTPAAFPSREGLVSARLVEHENVLRAAMIVFLMMQEQSNA